MAGILTICEWLIEAIDDNDDFTGSTYTGDAIIRVMAGLGEDVRAMKSSQHPNLLRAMVQVDLLRVRVGAGNPHLRDLFVAFMDKIRNMERVQAIFKGNLTAVDDPENPATNEITNRPLWLGVNSNFRMPPPQYSGQREETLTFQLWVYQQRFPKQMTESLIGE